MLKKAYVARETFDPTNELHLKSFDVFVRTGNWGDVQFYPELPYIDVPMTVLMKFAEQQRGVKRENRAEAMARLEQHEGLIRYAGLSALSASEEAERQASLEAGNRLLKEALAARN